MQHLEALPPYAFAKGACYRCGATFDLVDMDVHIEGEGCLAICTTCINEAAEIAKPGRRKMRAKDKAAAEETRRATAV